MPAREVEIVNKLGLHLRAAAAFVQLAEKYRCKVHLSKDGRRANGKSILSVLSLEVPRGSRMVVETSGSDEKEALAALASFISNRFGEAE